MQAGADATLIEASRRGDREAFAQIIERYQRAVYAVAFSGVRDRALADDVAQDTFVIAWQRLDKLRDEARLAAWLCGIARNRARDVRRQSQRETVGAVDELPHATTPYDQMTEAESERAVVAALAEVPDAYREPLILYYFEDCSIDDVARSLGISAATTNKRLSRGRRYLSERVALVERGLVRRGPSPGFAASVLALVGVTASASHVDASPAVAKGSTMHKLAIAAAVTAAVGGAGVLAVNAMRNDAHAETRAAPTSGPTDAERAANATTAAHEGGHGPLCDLMARVQAHAPSLASLIDGNSSAAEANDCVTVGKHLAQLQADSTHGPNLRPDDTSFDTCSSQYMSMCQSEDWSVERRNCTLEASDLINAHLCAGQATSEPAPNAIPANLSCAVLGAQVAAILQAAQIHENVSDLPQQIEAACGVGTWSIELRTCFASATSVDDLKTCITPE